jgi:hypothetical protein
LKTISITGNNRPEYLKRVVDSIKKNDYTQFDLLCFFLEPNCPENIKIADSVNFIKTYTQVNHQKLGVRKNPYNALKTVFEFGSEFNVYLEDDSILSPDSFDLANFYFNLSTKDKYIACAFFNMFKANPSKKTQLFAEQELSALGFCLFKENWNKWFSKYWFDDKISVEQKIGGIGWDWSIRAMMKKYNLKVLTPFLNRSQHIGRNKGTHCSPECHDSLFNKHTYCQEKIGDFQVED